MSLKNIFHDKPILFICHGQSLKELENNIDKFRDKDVYWVTLNQHKIAQRILDKIDKKLYASVFYAREYRDREIDGHNLKESKGRGNSLFEFLSQCLESGLEKVFIFGADGWSEQGDNYYKGNTTQGHRQSHIRDTDYFNAHFPKNPFYNVSIKSKYKPIRKITIEECLSLL